MQVQLDVSFAPYEDLVGAVSKMTSGRNVTARVVELAGPAGGWPVVEFDGGYTELRRVMKHNGYGDLIDEYLPRQDWDAPLELLQDGADLIVEDRIEHLTPIQARVLNTLIERRGQTVTRADLKRAGWGDPDVRDGLLSMTVYYVRAILERDGEPRTLRSVVGHGYVLD